MANLGTFDASTVDPTNHFEAIPAGEYLAMVVASEMKDTKTSGGKYLQLTLQIQDGQYSGRKLFDRLNLINSNLQAVDIAQRQLSQLCHAVGVLKINDSDQLHNRPCMVKVAVKMDPGRDPSNEVKGYRAAQMSAPPAFQPPRQAAPAFAPPPAAPAFQPPPAAPAAPWAPQAR